MNKTIKKIITILSLIFFLSPNITLAAILYIDPSAGEYAQGDTIIVKVKIDNQGDCINAADISLKFSDNLRAVDFSSGNSIINIWIDQPDTSDMQKINMSKQLTFSGGIPGGYCGPIKGDQGESNILAEVVFSVINGGNLNDPNQNKAEISFGEDLKLLLNDGLGTPATANASGSVISIISSSTQENSEWSKRLEEDDIPPEPFTVELLQDPRVYEGKYYIIFSSSDKQTGIDHYEVMEQKLPVEKNGNIDFLKGLIKEKPAQWKIAQSPYLLEDQSLGSDIYVKAVDKAGNEKTIKYSAKAGNGTQAKGSFLKDVIMVILLTIIVFALIPVAIKIIRIFKKNIK